MIQPGQRWKLRASVIEIVEIIRYVRTQDGSSDSIAEVKIVQRGGARPCNVELRGCFPANSEENIYWELLKGQEAP